MEEEEKEAELKGAKWKEGGREGGWYDQNDDSDTSSAFRKACVHAHAGFVKATLWYNARV